MGVAANTNDNNDNNNNNNLMRGWDQLGRSLLPSNRRRSLNGWYTLKICGEVRNYFITTSYQESMIRVRRSMK